MTQIHSPAPAGVTLVASQVVWSWLLFSAVSLASMFAIAGQEKVFVTEIHGSVGMKGKTEPVALLETLAIGTVVQLSKGARLVVFYPADAAEYRVQGPASYRIAADALQPVGQAPSPIKKELPAAYRAVKVQANSLVQAGTVLRNAGKRNQGMRPSAEKVDPTQISFRWHVSLTPGTRIALFDKNDATLWETLATLPPMMLPPEVKLAAGETYRWQLVAPNATLGRQPWAEFDVLSTEMTERLRLARPSAGAPVSANIVFALLLDSSGATSMAQDVWSELATKYPEVDTALRKSVH